MRNSKFMNSVDPDVEVSRSSRYGLSEVEWSALSPEERAIHYNRKNVCEHPYVYLGPDNEDIRSSWSFDPYAHTPHLRPHSAESFFAGTCECQTCAGKFGIPRDQEKRHINPDQLRERLKLTD